MSHLVCEQQYRLVITKASDFLICPFTGALLISYEQILSPTKTFILSLPVFYKKAGRQESKVFSSPGLVARLIYIRGPSPGISSAKHCSQNQSRKYESLCVYPSATASEPPSCSGAGRMSAFNVHSNHVNRSNVLFILLFL